MAGVAGAGGSLGQRLLARAATDPTRPLLTWYDATGAARVELSGASFGNAVAKTAGLLVNDLGVASGTRVDLELPAHWQLAVWLVATWSAGCVASVVPSDDLAADEPPAVAVIGPQDVATRSAAAFARGADDVVAVSLDPLGAPLRGPLPALVVDHAAAARSQPDEFAPLPVALTAPVWSPRSGSSWSGEAVLEYADRRQPPSGWLAGDRLWHPGPVTTLDDVVVALVAPLLHGASVLWWRNPPGPVVVGTVAAEQVTVASRATAGLPPAVRVLARAPVSS
jgi:uncharacterized protein (TIGR03089 family)